jgi:hypothetical protein
VSETERITIHSIEKGGFYIDTPGFDDSDEDKSDDETIHEIYLEMLKANIRNLTTILWFVMSDVRAKSSYKRQARFIESLSKYYNGNVWDNTIIVTKGDKILDGPRNAAREIAQKKRNTKDDLLSGTADFKILLFESLSPTDVYVNGSFTSDQLNKYGVYKASEPGRILAKYESLMKRHLEHPIRLELRKVKCSKCSEETDPRFATSKCHEIESFHPSAERVHGGNVIDIHPSPLYYKHPYGYVEATWRTESTGGFIGRVIGREKVVTIPGYYLCCNNNYIGSQGCRQFYRCCEKDNGSSGCQKIYDGCRHEAWITPCTEICSHCKKKLNTLDTNGCKEKCKNCQSHDARYQKGCMKTSHEFPQS